MESIFVGSTPINWDKTTLGDVINRSSGLLQTGPFGSQLHASDYVTDGVPFVMPVNIGDNRLLDNNLARISEKDAVRLSRHRLRAGDIIYSRRGDVEKRALIRPEQAGWICGSGCLLVRSGIGVIDPIFLAHYLGHPSVREWIVRHAVGATMPNLNTSIMEAVPILLPPLLEQRAIASILGALDDKIELSRRMNATLEAMARAIFQSWFVDFDPVRAKAEGRETGLPAEIAALFPDGFVESGHVRRPSTWPQGQLTDLLVLQRGFDLPSSSRAEGPYPVLAASGPSGTHNEYAVKGPGVTTGRSGALGKVFLVQDDFWPLNTSLWVKEFRISRPYHAYFLLQTLDFATYNAGSAVPTLNRNHVHNLPMALPPVEVVEYFEMHVGPLFQQIQGNDRQISILSVIRDTLLPKLVSGALRVPEVGEVIRANLVSSSV